jgi:hypothetical protein
MVKFILMLMLTPLLCFANPAPFGLEIGKMTVQELKAKYDQKYEVSYKHSKSSSYSISPEIFNFNGLKEIWVEFDRNQILASIYTSFDIDKYDYLFNMLKDKYKLDSSRQLVMGTKERRAHFDTDDLYIYLREARLDTKYSEVQLSYRSKKFLDDKEWYDNQRWISEGKSKDFFQL